MSEKFSVIIFFFRIFSVVKTSDVTESYIKEPVSYNVSWVDSVYHIVDNPKKYTTHNVDVVCPYRLRGGRSLGWTGHVTRGRREKKSPGTPSV